jgi:anti-anti-sigma regulatory factor
MSAMAVETGLVSCTRLADGMIVQLAGALSREHVAELRATLLAPLPADCRDVVIDAGDVSDCDFDALAVVFAAWAWVEEKGSRFLLSRTSDAFDAALAANGVAGDLPRLADLSSAPTGPVIPRQRARAR